MKTELQNTIDALKSNQTILYPTDTIWGLGSLASNKTGVAQLFTIKNRPKNKSVILLVSSFEMLKLYVQSIPESLINYLNLSPKPTTAIYKASENCPKHLISDDGTIAIRIIKDVFCNTLISELNEAITSTSANISDQKNPYSFSEIDERILEKVDYVVNWRQDEESKNLSSDIIKLDNNNKILKIR